MLSFALAEAYGLETKDREEVTRDIIGTILRIVMVCLFPVCLFDLYLIYYIYIERKSGY